MNKGQTQAKLGSMVALIIGIAVALTVTIARTLINLSPIFNSYNSNNGCCQFDWFW